MKITATTSNNQTQGRAVANNVSQQKSNTRDDSDFVDNRPETKALESLQMIMRDSPRMGVQRQRKSYIAGGKAKDIKGPDAKVSNGPAESSTFIRLSASSPVSVSPMMINYRPQMAAQRQRTSNWNGGKEQLIMEPDTSDPKDPAESSKFLPFNAPSPVFRANIARTEIQNRTDTRRHSPPGDKSRGDSGFEAKRQGTRTMECKQQMIDYNARTAAQRQRISTVAGETDSTPMEQDKDIPTAKGETSIFTPMNEPSPVSRTPPPHQSTSPNRGKRFMHDPYHGLNHPRTSYNKPTKNTTFRPLQRKYADPIDKPGKAIKALALASPAGEAAYAAGKDDQELEVKSSGGWRAITKQENLQIAVEEADYDVLDRSGEGILEKEKEELVRRLTVQVAHELTHLRHFLEDKISYRIRGRPGDWGIEGWDADPEEAITIKGKTQVRIVKWEAMAVEALQDDPEYIEASTRPDTDKAKVQAKSTGWKAAEIRLAAGTDEKRAAEMEKAYKEQPKGAEVIDDYYVFNDVNNENKMREKFGLPLRTKYSEKPTW